jgi:hypothetical protein
MILGRGKTHLKYAVFKGGPSDLTTFWAAMTPHIQISNDAKGSQLCSCGYKKEVTYNFGCK